MDPATEAIKTKSKQNKKRREEEQDVSITDNIFPPLFKTGHKRKNIKMFPSLLVVLMVLVWQNLKFLMLNLVSNGIKW